jgi:hypothetical protein
MSVLHYFLRAFKAMEPPSGPGGRKTKEQQDLTKGHAEEIIHKVQGVAKGRGAV